MHLGLHGGCVRPVRCREPRSDRLLPRARVGAQQDSPAPCHQCWALVWRQKEAVQVQRLPALVGAPLVSLWPPEQVLRQVQVKAQELAQEQAQAQPSRLA